MRDLVRLVIVFLFFNVALTDEIRYTTIIWGKVEERVAKDIEIQSIQKDIVYYYDYYDYYDTPNKPKSFTYSHISKIDINYHDIDYSYEYKSNKKITREMILRGFGLQLETKKNNIIENQEGLKKAQEKITENHNKLDVTDSKLDEAVEKFNQISSKLEKTQKEIIELNESKKILDYHFNSLKKATNEQIDKFNSNTADFIKTSETRIDGFVHKMDSLSEKVQIYADFQTELNKTNLEFNRQTENFNSKFNWLIISLVLTILLFSSVFYYRKNPR